MPRESQPGIPVEECVVWFDSVIRAISVSGDRIFWTCQNLQFREAPRRWTFTSNSGHSTRDRGSVKTLAQAKKTAGRVFNTMRCQSASRR